MGIKMSNQVVKTEAVLFDEHEKSEEYAADYLRLNQASNIILRVSNEAEVEFAERLITLKKRSKDVYLEFVIPFEAQADDWNENLSERYFNAFDHCDKEAMIQGRFSLDASLKTMKYLRSNSFSVHFLKN